MEKIIWNAYQKFRCIAQNCEDSCCKGWEVDIDEATARDYRSRQGELGDRLRQVMRTVDGNTSMILQQGRCPMWRQDGLCQIQAQWGHDALCQVCREYPRLYLDYGDFVEWGLELSCPEAARLIFADIQTQTVKEESTIPAEYDREVMTVLQRSREELLRYWNNAGNIPQALAVTLLYAYYVQDAVDGGAYTPLEPAQCLEAACRYKGAGDIAPVLEFFLSLEILTPQWKDRLQKPAAGEWDHRLRVLAQYLIRRYWLQAVWDYDLTCRVKFIIAACVLVHYLGGDTVQTAQLFAKEIENDPDNREAILDAAYTHEAFTDANLLGLLLN